MFQFDIGSGRSLVNNSDTLFGFSVFSFANPTVVSMPDFLSESFRILVFPLGARDFGIASMDLLLM